MSDFQAGLDYGREALRRFLVGEDELKVMLTKIALIAVETVPLCDFASITMVSDGQPHTPVSTEKTALELDETQYSLGHGPCLSAMRHQGVERVSTATDDRWPPFNEAALQRGVHAVLSVPMADGGAAIGGLNLYSTTTNHFDDHAAQAACLFADQLGLAAANAARFAQGYQIAEQLKQAMESRAAIEQAKGILMAAQGCSPDRAFEILVQASQHQNRKLRDIAAEIVERRTREAPK